MRRLASPLGLPQRRGALLHGRLPAERRGDAGAPPRLDRVRVRAPAEVREDGTTLEIKPGGFSGPAEKVFVLRCPDKTEATRWKVAID